MGSSHRQAGTEGWGVVAGVQEAVPGRYETAVSLLSLAILGLALLWPVVRHPEWWIWPPGAAHSDLAVTHWPNAHFTRRALWEQGRFPLWRRTIMGGTPFAANPLAGLYYPLNWLLLFPPWLSLEVGFNLSALFHLWLAGAAMYHLMRRGFGTSVWGAIGAAVVYEASPKLLAHLGVGHVGWVQAWGWLPVVVFGTMQALRERVRPADGGMEKQGEGEVGRQGDGGARARKFAILTGVVLAVQFCADVRMMAYTLAAAGTLLLASTIRNRRYGIRHLPLAVRSLAVFGGLAACQWMPLVALLRETTRASMDLQDATVWSLPWQYLAGLLLADHGGFHEWMTYVGIGTLVLAGVGIAKLKRRRVEWWCAGWLVSLVVGAGWFSLGENGRLFQVLWRFVPGLGLLRVPPRAWVLVVFALAVLAGLGLEETLGQGHKRTRRRGRWKQALLMGIGVLPPFLLIGYLLLVEVPPSNLVIFGLVTPLAVVLVGFGFPGSRLQIGSRVRPEALRGLAIVLLVTVDLLIVNATLVATRSPEQVFADGRAAAEWLAAQSDHFRVYSPSYSIPQQVAELYGLELADGIDPLQLQVYADYLTIAAGLEPQGYSVTLPPFPRGSDVQTALKDVEPDAELMGLLGVQYTAAAFPIASRGWQQVGRFEGVYVLKNERTGPLVEATGAGGIVLADGEVLFRYRAWPVYAGWAVSGATIGLLLAGWCANWNRRRRADG